MALFRRNQPDWWLDEEFFDAEELFSTAVYAQLGMKPFPKTPLSPALHPHLSNVQNTSRVPPPSWHMPLRLSSSPPPSPPLPPLISSRSSWHMPLSVSSSPPPSLLTSAYSKRASSLINPSPPPPLPPPPPMDFFESHLHPPFFEWCIPASTSSHGAAPPPPPSTNRDCIPLQHSAPPLPPLHLGASGVQSPPPRLRRGWPDIPSPQPPPGWGMPSLPSPPPPPPSTNRDCIPILHSAPPLPPLHLGASGVQSPPPRLRRGWPDIPSPQPPPGWGMPSLPSSPPPPPSTNRDCIPLLHSAPPLPPLHLGASGVQSPPPRLRRGWPDIPSPQPPPGWGMPSLPSSPPPPPSTNRDCIPLLHSAPPLPPLHLGASGVQSPPPRLRRGWPDTPSPQPPPGWGMPSLPSPPPTPGQGVLSQPPLGCGIEPYRGGIVIENREDICTIFSEDCADKGDARTFQEVNDEIGVDYATSEDSLDNCDEKVDVIRDLLAQQKLKKTASSSNSQGPKKKSSMDKFISDCMKQMTTAFSDYLVVERKKSELVIAEKELMLAEKKKLNVQEIVAELKTFYLNDMQIIKVLDLMMHDRILFDMFAGMPTELKYKWLKVQLDKGSLQLF